MLSRLCDCHLPEHCRAPSPPGPTRAPCPFLQYPPPGRTTGSLCLSPCRRHLPWVTGLGALAAWAPVAMPWTVMERPAWSLRAAISTVPHRDSAAWERPGRPRLQAPGSEGGRHPGSGRPAPCGRFPPGAQGSTSSQLGPWVREHPTGGSRAPGVGGLALAASVGGDLPASASAWPWVCVQCPTCTPADCLDTLP